jgi:hypothetical protein
MDERPLWVQLYWGKDQREGRFVLQNAKLPKVCTKQKKIFYFHCFFLLSYQNQSVVVLKNVDHQNVNLKKRKSKIKYVNLLFVFNKKKKSICIKYRVSLFSIIGFSINKSLSVIMRCFRCMLILVL